MNINRKLSIEIKLPNAGRQVLLRERYKFVTFGIYDYGYSFDSNYYEITHSTERHTTNDYD